MKKNNLKVVKIDKNKSLFNYEKKILINELILDLKLGYYDFEKERAQKVKFSLEIDYQDKKPSNDKDLRSIVNYATIVKLIWQSSFHAFSFCFLETAPISFHFLCSAITLGVVASKSSVCKKSSACFTSSIRCLKFSL